MTKDANICWMSMNTIKQKFSDGLEALRFRLARPDALLHLAFFGLITGLLSGGVIVLFRLLVEHTQDYLLPGEGAENYEMLPPILYFLFPVISSIILALLFYKYSKGIRVLGVARVIERVAYHQGYLTPRGFILQLVGAAVAIIGGHSVGREGPHAYLGASASSLFGQFFKLPNNSIRTLVACGAAAGIAASFNTPLAGVIFSLEIIMMEYALHSFVPVMLAAVSATALSNAILGNAPAFIIPTFQATSLYELPIVLVLGVIVGAFAALFNHVLTLIATHTKKIEIWWKLLMAGVLVGLLGLIQPEILG
ncbi:MAG TPA: chloride channel protein, partial [Leucothrix sp.]|nr:chloride channel protein [Leucothrix sp.]